MPASMLRPKSRLEMAIHASLRGLPPLRHERLSKLEFRLELIVRATTKLDVFDGVWPVSSVRNAVVELDLPSRIAAPAAFVDERAPTLVPCKHGPPYVRRNHA